MTPTPEQARAAMERLRAHIAFVKSRGSKLNECERDEELVLTLLDASARALGPFAEHEVWHDDEPDSFVIAIEVFGDRGWSEITQGDLREAHRVRALIAAKTEG